MQSPFDSHQDSSPYAGLQKQMFQRVQVAEVDEQIVEVVKKAYDDAVSAEQIVLSRNENKRLHSHILKLVLEDMVKKLDNPSARMD